MVVVKPTGKGGKPLKPKEIKPKNKSTGGSIEKVPGGYSKEGLGRINDKGLKGRSPQKAFSEKEKRMESTKAQGMTKKMGGGMMKKYSKGGQMLKSGQKKLDKNKDGKISGEDFKLIRREKPEMKPIKKAMGGTMEMAKEAVKKYRKEKASSAMKRKPDSKAGSSTKDIFKSYGKYDGKPIELSKGGEMKKGYGAARQSGMGLQDENLVPGKSMDYYKDLM